MEQQFGLVLGSMRLGTSVDAVVVFGNTKLFHVLRVSADALRLVSPLIP